MKIAVVILNWNGISFLSRFLKTVVEYSPEATVFLADNASTDDSISYVRQHFPFVEIVQNASNEGFARGYNEALKQISAEYYVLLNSDVEVTYGWLNPIIQMMEDNANLAAVQPKIMDWNDRNRFEYAGAAGGYIDAFAYPFCRGRIFENIEYDLGQYEDACDIFWASGAAMFIRAPIFHALGGFDEEFFAHMEEIDLCWRIHNRGYQIAYCPNSVVYHVGGGTLHKSNPHKTYLNFRNNLMMLYKNVESKRLGLVIFIRLLLDGLAGIQYVMRGNFADCIAIIRAHFYFYGNFKKQKAKRLLESQKRVGEHPAKKWMYSRSLVFDYFLFQKKKFSQLSWRR